MGFSGGEKVMVGGHGRKRNGVILRCESPGVAPNRAGAGPIRHHAGGIRRIGGDIPFELE